MRVWRWIALVVLLLVLIAMGLYWVSLDPGYVLVRLGGWQAETTAVVAMALILLTVAVLALLWRLLRWPFGALSRRHWRRSQRRLGEGLTAFAEGRYGDAERDFIQASRLPQMHGPALLAAAEAAARRGELAHAYEALDQAGQSVPQATRVLRARLLREEGRAIEALGLLTAEAEMHTLGPGGWHEWVLAALAAEQPGRALDALDALHRSGALGVRAYAALEARVLQAGLKAVPDRAALDSLWARLPKAQRRIALAVNAYVRQAARFGANELALETLETALKREWSPLLVTTYGQLPLDPVMQLAKAEGWLSAHPDDAALRLSLGQLAIQLRRWPQARAYLQQALALAPSAAVWEALGEVLQGTANSEAARICYRNALALWRGEAVTPLPESALAADEPLAAPEARNEHGVPQLPT